MVHGKGSLIGKMPGDEWQKFANLRLLFAYMFAQPGKKLLFMGCEFGQVSEWSHDRSLDWDVLQYPVHRGLMNWVEQLNRLYRNESPLHWFDNDPKGFEWVDCNDAPMSVVSLLRKGKDGENPMLIACNFTPVPRVGYMVGVPDGRLLERTSQQRRPRIWRQRYRATWEAPRRWPQQLTGGRIRCD